MAMPTTKGDVEMDEVVEPSSPMVPRSQSNGIELDSGDWLDGRNETTKEFQDLKKLNLNKRECIVFVDNGEQDPATGESVCVCKHLKSKHGEQGTSEWTQKRNTEVSPTDAFGEIEFASCGDKFSKFVRVDSETDMDTMMKVLTDVWGMKNKPKLLISVTGGAKGFAMKGCLKEMFRIGLMRAAHSTDAWIITGGTNTGVMKHVGEAVRDFGLTADGRVNTIGIAAWGCVRNKKELIDPKGKWPAFYRVENDDVSGTCFLDPNHTHFILVDNGTQKTFGTETEFRAKLEHKIATMNSHDGKAVTVPTCLLVLEGGPGTLHTVHSAIENGTPTVVFKGSGRVADILAFAYQNMRQQESPATYNPWCFAVAAEYDNISCNVPRATVFLEPPDFDMQLKEMIQKHIPGDQEQIIANAEKVKDCCQRPELLSVFAINSKDSVDLAILKALLKANKNEVMDQLQLALAWNRIDVAKSEIFTDERTWTTGELHEMMMLALKDNRADFVELFLMNEVSLKDFLTPRRLLLLYNEIPTKCLLHSMLTKTKGKERKNFSLKDVGNLIQSLLGDFYEPHYLTHQSLVDMDADAELEKDYDRSEKGGFSQPAQELFIWSVLMNHQELSKIFWKEGYEATAAALFASSICKSMMNYSTDNSDVKRKLEATKEEYDQLAMDVINECYNMDEKKTNELLERIMPRWGTSSNCVDLATYSDNKRFLHQPACQALLSRMWMGKMSSDNSWYKVLFLTLVAPLFFGLIKFDGEEDEKPIDALPTKSIKGRGFKYRKMTHKTSRQESQAENLKKNGSYKWYEKISLFYTSPIVKYAVYVESYILFLCLFAYMIVVELSPEFHPLEAILIGWVVTIFTEEIRQFLSSYANRIKTRIKTYFADDWNKLDVLTILFFVLGFGFRFAYKDYSLGVARVFFSLNFIMFCFRVLHIFTISKNLGPKVVMIWKMMKDLLWFLVIFLLFIISYAIASEAVLYPNAELNWKLLYYLPRKAYWHIYGELFLEDIEGKNECTRNSSLYSDYSMDRCPSEVGQYYVPILLGLYILVTNVLLLNLLIAMFSYTFSSIQENTDMHWAFLRCNLILEYKQRPPLPPPFIFLCHISILSRWLYRKCKCCVKKQYQIKREYTYTIDGDEQSADERQLIQWENLIADNYLSEMVKKKAESVDGRVKVSQERLESIVLKIDELHENHVGSSKEPMRRQYQRMDTRTESSIIMRVDEVEIKLQKMDKKLDHVVKLLEVQNRTSNTGL